MRKIALLILGFLPAVCFGLGYDEFILYSLDATGHEVNLVGPETKDSPVKNAEGNIVGIIQMLSVERKGESGSSEKTRCEMDFEPPSFRCGESHGSLSKTVYEGHRITDSNGKEILKLDQFHQIKNLKTAFLKQYEYGQVASYFECKSGCGKNNPQFFILVWRGD